MIRFINDLNLKKQADELGVKIWFTPSFLFLMMGVIIMIAMTATYYISKNYDSPEVLAMAECVVVAVIFIIGNSIIHEVEQIARLNKMKSEFVSIASHQLRTPLSAIRWETEILLSKFAVGLNEKQKDAIESISQTGQQMLRLVNDLLDVARIDQGRLILKKEKINLTMITREVIRNILPLAQAGKVIIIFDEKKQAWILGDAEKLKLAIENLLSNAVKYTLGKGVVEITLQKKDDSYIFSIRDNGAGIPEAQQKKIFEKFFRSDNALKNNTTGTGLGLYITKNIVEQSGGKVWFESRENEGSVFNFSIPIYSSNSQGTA
jgi:signal transduction histidine kinase